MLSSTSGSKVVLGLSPHRLGMGEKAVNRRAMLLRAKAHNYFRCRDSLRRSPVILHLLDGIAKGFRIGKAIQGLRVSAGASQGH